MEMTIIRRNDRNGAVVAYLKGIVDGEAAGVFEKRILDLIAGEDRYFVINMSETDYITSAGLRSFLVIGKMLRIRHGRIAVCNCGTGVIEVLKLMNFESLFAIYADEESALASFGETGHDAAPG